MLNRNGKSQLPMRASVQHRLNASASCPKYTQACFHTSMSTHNHKQLNSDTSKLAGQQARQSHSQRTLCQVRSPKVSVDDRVRVHPRAVMYLFRNLARQEKFEIARWNMMKLWKHKLHSNQHPLDRWNSETLKYRAFKSLKRHKRPGLILWNWQANFSQSCPGASSMGLSQLA